MRGILIRLASAVFVVSVFGVARGADSVKCEQVPQPNVMELEKVFGPGSATRWKVPDKVKDAVEYHVEYDKTIGRDVLVVDKVTGPGLVFESRTIYGSNVEVNCLVRLGGTERGQNDMEKKGGSFAITTCRDPMNEKAEGVGIGVSGMEDSVDIAVSPLLENSRYMFNNTNMMGGMQSGGGQHKYKIRAYSVIEPTWDDRMRVPIEQDMSLLPKVKDKWISIRIQIGDKWVRAWVDDRLVVDDDSDGIRRTGVLILKLGAGAHVAEVKVSALEEQFRDYEPIRLDGYARDRVLAGKGVGVKKGALPYGSMVKAGGIPFRFVDVDRSAGGDHIDVGGSMVREGNMEGGEKMGDSFEVDPARIKLRIPNGRYDAMYMVAGFDGEPDNIPLVSAHFYRPVPGFSMIFEGEAPSIFGENAEAGGIPVELEDGKKANLWLVKIPLDPGMLSSFGDMGFVEMELTKKMCQYRAYPDPWMYGWRQGGLPSGVHIYALTLHRPEVEMEVAPEVFGHVWKYGETPVYEVRLTNQAEQAQEVKVVVESKSYDGQETDRQEKALKLDKRVGEVVAFKLDKPKKNGYHDLVVSMEQGGRKWVERRSFVKLGKDTRETKWEDGKGPLFGYWSYSGGHYTPSGDRDRELMRSAGARRLRGGVSPKEEVGFGCHSGWDLKVPQEWVDRDPTPVEYQELKKHQKDAILRHLMSRVSVTNIADLPTPEWVGVFPEPCISLRLTFGNYPEYWGESPYQLTDDEKKRVRLMSFAAKAAAEGIREQYPNIKVLIPWGDALFVAPLLRAGFPTNLVDGVALDNPGFERLPEQQLHQFSPHRLYMLRKEFEKVGIKNPVLWYAEGIFVPTEPGACTWEEQADIYHRWTLMSMAYGVDRFYSGWFTSDNCDYYGTEHYGGCGILNRIPYCNPKPGYAVYATMTRMLERAKYEKWLPTGSLSTYCLKFSRPKEKGGPVFALWTICGKRPVTLTLVQEGAVRVIDSMDNSEEIKSKDKAVTFVTSPSVKYVEGVDEIEKVTIGEPDHSGSVEWARGRNRATWHTGPLARGAEVNYEKVIGSLGDGTWRISEKRDKFNEVYEGNNYDTMRYQARMGIEVKDDKDKGKALAVKFLKQDKVHELMPWYTVLEPGKPIEIPGKALGIGLWVRGVSDWGRVVYCMRDAEGELWISVGGKDAWNADDVHSWSYFNFDGWRYVRLEMPGHTEWDTFREYGTTFWGSVGGKGEGKGVVDLPLKLERLIIERRSHVLYVNDVQPTGAESNDVLLGDLVMEYGKEKDAGDEAVKLNQKRMPLPKGQFELPNPIKEMGSNQLAPIKVNRVKPPEYGYDGTCCEVHFDQVETADSYDVWVGRYKDGQGAVKKGTLKKSGGMVGGLRPGMKLCLWVTYTEKLSEEAKKRGDKPRQSKPSNTLEIELVDAFGFK